MISFIIGFGIGIITAIALTIAYAGYVISSITDVEHYHE